MPMSLEHLRPQGGTGVTAIEEPDPNNHAAGSIGPVPGRVVYISALAISALLLAVAGITELLPWPAVMLGAVAIAATKIEGSHWVPLGGGLLFALIVLVVNLSGVGEAGYAERLTAQTGTDDNLPAPAEATGSLGIHWGEVSNRWNGLGHPPTMTSGLTRETESGPYDTFRYRFDDAAVLAGAFDREDGSVHALMASVGLFHGAAPNFYLHLCFMLHPYSQECIDAYLEEGLASRQLSEYAGVDHQAQWELGDQLWKLEIAEDVQTIRVLSESAR